MGDGLNMRNKKMLNKFKASLACICMFSQASGVTHPTSSETQIKKYSVVDELKTSIKQDVSIWLLGGASLVFGVPILDKICKKDSSKPNTEVINYETSQYKISHDKINLENAEIDVIQGNLMFQISELRKKINTHKISNFVLEYFNSIDQNIDKISEKITKYFVEETGSDEKKQLILEIKNIINEFSKTMATKDKNWGWYYLDKCATDKDVLGVAIEVMFKYITRLIHVYDENYLLQINKKFSLNAQNILARLDSSQNFYDVYSIFQDYTMHSDSTCDKENYAPFSELSTMYKNLLETGKIN